MQGTAERKQTQLEYTATSKANWRAEEAYLVVTTGQHLYIHVMATVCTYRNNLMCALIVFQSPVAKLGGHHSAVLKH